MPRGSSTIKAGAVPLGFSTGMEPDGIYACLSLLAVAIKPRR